MTRPSLGLTPQRKTLLAIWALWVVVVIAFQAISAERVRLVRPDYAVSWSSWETELGNNLFKDYLNEDFLNQQVAWDSEYYLGIAVGGYDDPIAGTATDPDTNKEIPRNYSFFPFYPALIRIVAVPLSLIGLNAIATATLASFDVLEVIVRVRKPGAATGVVLETVEVETHRHRAE